MLHSLTIKSRRDDTLLTVGFNLRTTDTAHIHPSPAWDDTLLSGVYISYAGKLCGFAALREIIISRKVAKTQRLKCTDIDREKYMMQVSSLRDFGAHDASPFRRLKPTVNRVSSLRDWSGCVI